MWRNEVRSSATASNLIEGVTHTHLKVHNLKSASIAHIDTHASITIDVATKPHIVCSLDIYPILLEEETCECCRSANICLAVSINTLHGHRQGVVPVATVCLNREVKALEVTEAITKAHCHTCIVEVHTSRLSNLCIAIKEVVIVGDIAIQEASIQEDAATNINAILHREAIGNRALNALDVISWCEVTPMVYTNVEITQALNLHGIAQHRIRGERITRIGLNEEVLREWFIPERGLHRIEVVSVQRRMPRLAHYVILYLWFIYGRVIDNRWGENLGCGRHLWRVCLGDLHTTVILRLCICRHKSHSGD